MRERTSTSSWRTGEMSARSCSGREIRTWGWRFMWKTVAWLLKTYNYFQQPTPKRTRRPLRLVLRRDCDGSAHGVVRFVRLGDHVPGIHQDPDVVRPGGGSQRDG